MRIYKVSLFHCLELIDVSIFANIEAALGGVEYYKTLYKHAAAIGPVIADIEKFEDYNPDGRFRCVSVYDRVRIK